MKRKTEGIIQFNRVMTFDKQTIMNVDLSFSQRIFGKYGVSRLRGKFPALIFQLYHNLFSGKTWEGDSNSSEKVSYARHYNVYKSFVNLVIRSVEPTCRDSKNPIPVSLDIQKNHTHSLNNRFFPLAEALNRSRASLEQHNKTCVLNTVTGADLSEVTAFKKKYDTEKNAVSGSRNPNTVPEQGKEPAINQAIMKSTEQIRKLFGVISDRKPGYRENTEKTSGKQGSISKKQDTLKIVYHDKGSPDNGRALEAPQKFQETAWDSLKDDLTDKKTSLPAAPLFMEQSPDLNKVKGKSAEQTGELFRVVSDRKPGYRENTEKTSGKQGSISKKQDTLKIVYHDKGSPDNGRALEAPQKFQETAWENYGSPKIVLNSRKAMTAVFRANHELIILKPFMKPDIDEDSDKRTGLIFNEPVINEAALAEEKYLNVFNQEQKADNPVLKAQNRVQLIKRFVISGSNINNNKLYNNRLPFEPAKKDNITRLYYKNISSPIYGAENRLDENDTLYLQQGGLILRKPTTDKVTGPKPDSMPQDEPVREKAADTQTFTALKQSKSINTIEVEEMNQLAEHVYKILEKRIAIQKDRRGLR